METRFSPFHQAADPADETRYRVLQLSMEDPVIVVKYSFFNVS
jgi:hypothetical protein